jgi:hypothetical protein
MSPVVMAVREQQNEASLAAMPPVGVSVSGNEAEALPVSEAALPASSRTSEEKKDVVKAGASSPLKLVGPEAPVVGDVTAPAANDDAARIVQHDDVQWEIRVALPKAASESELAVLAKGHGYTTAEASKALKRDRQMREALTQKLHGMGLVELQIKRALVKEDISRYHPDAESGYVAHSQMVAEKYPNLAYHAKVALLQRLHHIPPTMPERIRAARKQYRLKLELRERSEEFKATTRQGIHNLGVVEALHQPGVRATWEGRKAVMSSMWGDLRNYWRKLRGKDARMWNTEAALEKGVFDELSSPVSFGTPEGDGWVPSPKPVKVSDKMSQAEVVRRYHRQMTEVWNGKD